MNQNLLNVLIAAAGPTIVAAINIAYNAWSQGKLLKEKRHERLYEHKMEAVDKIMKAMMPAFVQCVEPHDPIQFFTSLNKLKRAIQDALFAHSVWLIPYEFEAVNQFLKAVIDCINLFADEIGSLERKDLAQFSDDDIEVFVAAYENHADAIINKLLDERRFLFFNLHQAFVAPLPDSPKQFRRAFTQKIKKTKKTRKATRQNDLQNT